MKDYHFTLDLIEQNSVELPGIVTGDTGNVFYILLLENGGAVDLTGCRIRVVITNKDGAHSQDSEVEDSDITVIEGVANEVETQGIQVLVHSGMISNGRNTGVVEVYQTSEESESEWDVKMTSQPWTFDANGSPSEVAASLPSIVELENQVKALIDTLNSYVELLDPENCVRYVEQDVEEAKQIIARANISAAAAIHAHGNITSDGKITGKSLKLVETDANGVIVAERSIIVTTVDPTTLTGLQDNDIILYDHT